MQTNFARLYSILRLNPDCSPAELQRAYRRRIAALHPDRDRPTSQTATSAAELRELLSLHSAAMQFHRDHGRLPGANQAQPAPVGGFAFAPKPDVAAPSERRPLLARPVLVLLLAGIAIVVASLGVDERSGHEDISSMPSAAPTKASSIVATPVPGSGKDAGEDRQFPTRLVVGMDEAIALELQGAPFRTDGQRWEYGPSWLLFERGRLVDWYSSPLYALKTDSPAPPQESE